MGVHLNIQICHDHLQEENSIFKLDQLNSISFNYLNYSLNHITVAGYIFKKKTAHRYSDTCACSSKYLFFPEFLQYRYLIYQVNPTLKLLNKPGKRHVHVFWTGVHQ